MVPRGTKRVLGHEPAGREDDKVSNGGSDMVRWSSEDGKYGWIRVVEGDGSDGVEAAEVVLVRVVVTVPGDDVEGSVVLSGRKEGVVEFAQDAVFLGCIRVLFVIIKGCNRSLEVTRVGETIGPNRAQLRQLVMALVEFTNVASNRAIGKLDAVS